MILLMISAAFNYLLRATKVERDIKNVYLHLQNIAANSLQVASLSPLPLVVAEGTPSLIIFCATIFVLLSSVFAGMFRKFHFRSYTLHLQVESVKELNMYN